MKEELQNGRQPNDAVVPAGPTEHLAQPEKDLLRTVLKSDGFARQLARAPGGWRNLSDIELDQLDLRPVDKRVVLALQELVSRGYPELASQRLSTSADVGRVYGARLGGLVYEVMIGIALDGRNNFIGEVEIAKGGAHGLSITARDVLRPMIRMGASAFVLVHNHPSGSPQPSLEDVQMPHALAACGEIVGVPLVDHVVVGAKGGGCCSLYDLGILDRKEGAARTERYCAGRSPPTR